MLGLENEVPLPYNGAPLVGSATTAFHPTDTTLGFNCPAPLGPMLLKDAKFPFTSVAPIVRTLSVSAGQITYFASPALLPELPALLVTKMPFFTAIFAPMLIIDVFPSLCA